MRDEDEGQRLLADDIELRDADDIARFELQTRHAAVESASEQKPLPRANTPVAWRDLPNKRQLFVLGLCRLSEPLSNTVLLPFIFYLLRSIVAPGSDAPTNEQHKQISQLSGVLVAVFPLAQLVTSMLWARWADTYGRRPIILGALLVSAISNLGFGFSRSFWALMLWRTLAGLANGNVGVMRAMTAEIVKERKYQTKAFLLLPLIFNSGMVIGLAVGGWLADHVANMAWLFGPEGLLNLTGNPEGVETALAFPFALPAIFNFACLSTSLLLATFGLNETLEGREGSLDLGLKIGQLAKAWLKQKIPPGVAGYVAIASTQNTAQIPEEILSVPTPSEKPADRVPPRSKIWTRDVLCALVSFGLLPMHNGAFMHIYPIFLSALPKHGKSMTGGMGMHSRSIGMMLSLAGLCGIMLQLFIYPRLQERLGTLGVFRVGLLLFPLVYLVVPFLVLLPETGVFRWACIAIVTWGQIMARTLAIPSTVILVTHSAPVKSALGRIHGAGNMAASFARAVGPALGGWVFARGIEHEMAGMVWWSYLFVVAVMALAWSFTMRRTSEI